MRTHTLRPSLDAVNVASRAPRRPSSLVLTAVAEGYQGLRAPLLSLVITEK
jgi:hypothetical protein